MQYATTPVALSVATILPTMDFETYSEAGYQYDEAAKKWRLAPGTPKGTSNGLAAVGAPAYAEHPSTEVLSLYYDLHDGAGGEWWLPGMAPPARLLAHLAAGGLIEAHNSGFEWYIWRYVCHGRMGWPALPLEQCRCSMAKCRAFSVPGSLDKAGEVLGIDNPKDKDGKRLLNKFSKPRNPTKKDARLRIRPDEELEDGLRLHDYCRRDVVAESQVSQRAPDLLAHEQQLWLIDQRINTRGVYIDREALDACRAVVDQAFLQYTQELRELTGGAVATVGELAKMQGFLAALGVHMPDMQSDTVDATLERDGLPPVAKRVLEIRQSLGSAGVKKLFSIDRRVNDDGRLRDLFAFCGADRTGRFSGRGPQPQNFPSGGPPAVLCGECDHYYGPHLNACPHCHAPDWAAGGAKWCHEAAEDALAVIKHGSVELVEYYFGDAVATVSGCLRGLFSAPPGRDLISSDYSAIEAVVLAALAGEEWRLEVFRTHGKIYEQSAATITGVPFEEMMRHAGYHDTSAPQWWEAPQTGSDHPHRKTIGKVAELASGYQGSVGAWKAFGADKFFNSDDGILAAVKAWRKASPAIVDFWYGLERAAKDAVRAPGACFSYRDITYGVKDDILFCRLPSGRFLHYHRPRLHEEFTPWGAKAEKLTFEGWNSDYKKGPTGWMRMDTYGGKLCENVVQASARDVMTACFPHVEAAGYQIVLHVHDELVTEVPEGGGSVEELERLMTTLPAWCAHWPIRAAGGWRGKRYRKG